MNIYISVHLNLDIFGQQIKYKNYAPNDSKNSSTSICSWFLHEWNFDSLGLFPNITPLPPFQKIYYLSIHIHTWFLQRYETVRHEDTFTDNSATDLYYQLRAQEDKFVVIFLILSQFTASPNLVFLIFSSKTRSNFSFTSFKKWVP